MSIEEKADQVTVAWKRALETTSLRIEGDEVSPATGGDAAEPARVTPLLHRAWLSLEGSDAIGFLHDQVSASVNELDESSARLAAYCNAQGRVLAVLRITREKGDLLCELPAGLAEPTARRLGMFVLRADVRIRREPHMTALGLWGESAEDLLARLGLAVPANAFGRARNERLSVIRLPGTVARFQLQGPVDEIMCLWKGLLEDATPAGTPEWRMQDIRTGMADVGSATTDQFLPQSLGLEAWSALSYRKGCYPGQEVIARAHYRGRLKRHLYRATVDAAEIRAGTPVSDEKGNRAGTVIESAPGAGERSALLAVLHERAEAGCRLAEPPGAALMELARFGVDAQWE